MTKGPVSHNYCEEKLHYTVYITLLFVFLRLEPFS